MSATALLLLCLLATAQRLSGQSSRRLDGTGIGSNLLVHVGSTASFEFPIPAFDEGLFVVVAPTGRAILSLDSNGNTYGMSLHYRPRYQYTGDYGQLRMKFNLTDVQNPDFGIYMCAHITPNLRIYRIVNCGQRLFWVNSGV